MLKRTAPWQSLRLAMTMPPCSSSQRPVVPGGSEKPQKGVRLVPDVGDPYPRVGGAGGAVSSTYVVTEAALTFPALSVAVTRIVYVPSGSPASETTPPAGHAPGAMITVRPRSSVQVRVAPRGAVMIQRGVLELSGDAGGTTVGGTGAVRSIMKTDVAGTDRLPAVSVRTTDNV